MKLTKEQIKLIEDNTVFSIEETSDGYDVSWYTDAGEDFSFYVSDENPVGEMIDYAENFDPEEHATRWIGGPGAPGLRTLLDDADEIQKHLFELKDFLLNNIH